MILLFLSSGQDQRPNDITLEKLRSPAGNAHLHICAQKDNQYCQPCVSVHNHPSRSRPYQACNLRPDCNEFDIVVCPLHQFGSFKSKLDIIFCIFLFPSAMDRLFHFQEPSTSHYRAFQFHTYPEVWIICSFFQHCNIRSSVWPGQSSCSCIYTNKILGPDKAGEFGVFICSHLVGFDLVPGKIHPCRSLILRANSILPVIAWYIISPRPP